MSTKNKRTNSMRAKLPTILFLFSLFLFNEVLREAEINFFVRQKEKNDKKYFIKSQCHEISHCHFSDAILFVSIFQGWELALWFFLQIACFFYKKEEIALVAFYCRRAIRSLLFF